jgi:replication factor C large subunit
MLLSKYKPTTLEEIIGNRIQIQTLFESVKAKKPVLLTGPTGTGKTLTAELIAKQLRYELVEINPLEPISNTLQKATEQQSLFYKSKLILIDDADSLSTVAGISDILKCKYPVIITAQNLYDPKLRNLRSKLPVIKFTKPRWNSIANYLLTICEKESVKYDRIAVQQLARSCNGDIRAAILDLESLPEITMDSVKAERDKEENIFETIKLLFSTISIENAKTIISQSKQPPEDILLWIEENAGQCYKQLKEFYKHASLADLNLSRTKISWSVYKHALFFIYLAAVSDQFRGFMKYNMPKRFTPRKYREETLSKIAKALHISQKDAIAMLPLVKRVGLPHLNEEDKKWLSVINT